jgi:fido (protein-threonine AMPylation protein)
VILFELTGGENNPIYKSLEISNGNRQYDFLRSIVAAALQVQRPFLSAHIIKALNFQAITCLHTNAGEYRPCDVLVGAYRPPEPYRVDALMEDFVNTVNRNWEGADPIALGAFVLWRLNYIHPFINGNGRTARATSYFVICVKVGGWLPGRTILPELIRREHKDYVAALQHADASMKAGALDLGPLHALLAKLLEEQIRGAGAPPPAASALPALLGPAP